MACLRDAACPVLPRGEAPTEVFTQAESDSGSTTYHRTCRVWEPLAIRELSALLEIPCIAAVECPARTGAPSSSSQDSWRATGRFASCTRGSAASATGLPVGHRPEHPSLGADAFRVAPRVGEIRKETGSRVSIVGHSRGGLLAKVYSQRKPDDIEQVIALGAPLANWKDLAAITHHAVGFVRVANELAYGRRLNPEGRFTYDLKLAPLVPTTSIYTKSDDVVKLRSCLRPDIPSMPVWGTHNGLVVDREVFRLVGRLLARPQASMTAIAVGLALTAAVFHGTWNVLVKVSGDPIATFRRATLVAGLVATIAFVPAWLVLGRPPLAPAAAGVCLLLAPRDALPVAAVDRLPARRAFGGVPDRARFGASAQRARRSCTAGERLVTVQLIGVGLLLLGILAVTLSQATGRATVPALLTGVAIAAYTTVDRVGHAVGLPAVDLRLAAFHADGDRAADLTVGCGATPPLSGGRPELWSDVGRQAVIIGVFFLAGYMLVLVALSIAPLAIVAPESGRRPWSPSQDMGIWPLRERSHSAIELDRRPGNSGRGRPARQFEFRLVRSVVYPGSRAMYAAVGVFSKGPWVRD